MSLSRRRFVQWAGSASALALTLPGTASAIPFAPDEGAIAFRPDLMPSADEVWSWLTWMAKLGPKFTGNAAHTTFVEFLATKLQASGLSLARDRYTLPLWEARDWGVKLTSSGKTVEVPTTGYYPYSGQTGESGVTGPLEYIGPLDMSRSGSKWKIQADERGKIVLADVPLTSTPYEEWWKPWGFTPGTTYPMNNMNGTWAIRVPDVGDLKSYGARGVIFAHQSISDEHAELLYSPFGRELQGMPAVWVGRDAGAELRNAAKAGANVTLTLDATVTPDRPTDTLLAELPGSSEDELIIVNTHTDGNNATEENGGIGLLALAQYFSRLPRASRRRTLVFVLATGHFAHAYVPMIRGVIERHPDLIKKAVGAVTVEHLGCREWLDDARMNYRPTGKNEFTLVITEFESTAKIMLDSLKATGDTRAGVVIPTPKGGFNGEGGPLSRAGVPTIGYIPIPTYLLATPANGCIDKLSKPFLHEQLHVLAKAIHKMDAMSRSELRGHGRLTSADVRAG